MQFKEKKKSWKQGKCWNDGKVKVKSFECEFNERPVKGSEHCKKNHKNQKKLQHFFPPRKYSNLKK